MENSDPRRTLRLAALYCEAGCEMSEPLIDKHRGLFNKQHSRIQEILRKVKEIQMRGPRIGSRTGPSFFNRFKLVEILKMPERLQSSKESTPCASGPDVSQCPLCGAMIASSAFEEHLRQEALGETGSGRTRVVVDRAFGIESKELHAESRTAWDLKQKIFEQTKIPISKQVLLLNGRPLGNKDKTEGVTVHLMLKKHY
ncbi:hypothetical protein PAPHI01_0827 [Pancytospora philotis]|nr:hypothetical protein PAPHI01_0827 [Pancytospora philotis]